MKPGGNAKFSGNSNKLSTELASDLPEGWTATKLCDVASMRLGKMLDAAKQLKGQSHPYLRNVNVRWGRIDMAELQTMRFTEQESIEFEIRDNDLLVCEGGEPGRAAVWKYGPTNVKFQKAIHRIRVAGNVTSDWLMYHLRAEAISGVLDDYFTGSTIKHLTGASLQQYVVRLPPLAEQRRIVAKLEALLAKVSTARERLSRVPSLLKRFRQSVLAAACSGRLTADWREENRDVERVGECFPNVINSFELPDTWGWRALGDYVENLDGKRVPVSAKLRGDRRGSFPYYGASGVIDSIDGFTHDGEFVLIGEDGANLLSRSTPIAFTAAGKIWVNNHAHVLQCKAGFPNQYLCYYVNSIDLAPWVTGTAQPKLNQSNMNTIPVPVPPLPEQHEIVRRVERLFTFADQIEARLKQAQSHVDRLTQSLLAKAFRGELVPTEAELARREGRSYESASELLERIRATKAEEAPAKRKRGKATKA